MEYDLAVAWEWPLDGAFVERLLARAAGLGLTAMAITRANLASVLQDLEDDRLRLRWLLDRATDEGPDYAPLGPLAEHRGTRLINHAQHQDRACDKARNHILCAAQGIPVPLTMIVPPFIDDPNPPLLPVALGRPFVVKPASGAGGEGVRLDAAGTVDVQDARRTFWRDRYLLQQRILPAQLAGRRAWFRVFYVCGHAIPCWWDDLSHVYAALAPEDELRLGLRALRQIVSRIAHTVSLDFFTSEIVLGTDGRLVSVDYANSPCDMRPQSRHHDGVPDQVIDRIVDVLLKWPADRAIAALPPLLP